MPLFQLPDWLAEHRHLANKRIGIGIVTVKAKPNYLFKLWLEFGRQLAWAVDAVWLLRNLNLQF